MISPSTQYPSLGKPLIILFNLLVLVWWLEVGMRMPLLATIRLEFLLAAGLSIVAIIRHFSQKAAARPRRRRSEDNSDIARCIVVFLVVMTLSLPLSIDLDVTWKAFVNRFVKLAVMGLLIPQFVVSPMTLRYYLFANLLAFMKIGQEALVGKLSGSMVWENQGVPRLHGTPETMFADPNSLSGKTVSTLPFLWFLFPNMQRWVKVLILLQLVFAINIIIFTASRTGYLTFIAASILILALSTRGRGRLILLLILAAILTVILLPDEYKGRFLSSFTGKEAEGQSFNTRKALLFDSLQAFVDNPLGLGLGGFRVYQDLHGRNAQETHNLYTQVLSEAGIQGFVCFVALVYVILRKLWRTRRALLLIVSQLEPLRAQLAKAGLPDLRDAQLLLATSTAVFMFVLVRLVLGLFGHDLLEIYWWFAAGVAMALHNMLAAAKKRCAEILSQGVPPPKASRKNVIATSHKRASGH